MTDPFSHATTYGYTANDLPSTTTLPNGVSATVSYNELNQPTSLSYIGNTADTYTYGYDALNFTNSVASTVDGTTTTRSITHDTAGRVLAVTDSNDPASAQNFSYDSNGNILTATAGQASTQYTYDSRSVNELTSAVSGPATTTYGYDSAGSTVAITSTQGTTTLSYDNRERLVGVHRPDGTQVTMGYDANGNRASVTVTQGVTTTLDEQFAYADGQVSKVVVTGNGGGTPTTTRIRRRVYRSN